MTELDARRRPSWCPLADVAAWTSHFRRAEIPVLRETVEALDALRAKRERTDANSIGEMIAAIR